MVKCSNGELTSMGHISIDAEVLKWKNGEENKYYNEMCDKI